MRTFVFIFLSSLSVFLYGQEKKQLRIEPPYWWSGFENKQLQLLVYGENIGEMEPQIQHQGIEITNVHKAESPNYLFLDLRLEEQLSPQPFPIAFYKGENLIHRVDYEIKAREENRKNLKGFDTSDLIYLITPDRFANGNPKNDRIENMREQKIDRTNDYARHGGDIQGIIDQLDYIEKMGMTAIWPSPLLTNDMPEQSYHGYAITDYYEVDPRFGTLENYIDLANKARAKGIKLIMDQVANHCGVHHWWMNDLPFSNWVNHQNQYEQKLPLSTSSHRRTTNQDPYAAEIDKKAMNEGWFVPQMPDLNQRNPFLANYLIQNSIWWIETLGLEGIRQDTYPYPDKYFMAKWAKAIMREYPLFSMVGEEWSYNPLLVGYWQQGNKNKEGYESHLSHTMDFPLQKAIQNALTQDEGWDTGLIALYDALANDFAYADPKRLMLFLDNHDMDRALTQYNNDTTLLKMGLATLMCLPRVPQMYYGTEVLLNNTGKPHDHGRIRTDFPGGWAGDKKNGFKGKKLSPQEKEMQDFVSEIAHFRKNSKAIHHGKTIHFVPENGVYVLFRRYKEESVVLFLNKNKRETLISLDRFKEVGLEGKHFLSVIGKDEFLWEGKLKLPHRGVFLFTNIKND